MEAKPDPPESEATAPVPVTVTEAVTVTAAPIAPEIIEIDDDEDDNDLVSADAKVSGASANPVQAVEKGTQGQKVNSTSLAVPPRPMPVNRFQKSDFELPYFIPMSTGQTPIDVNNATAIVCLKQHCTEMLEACLRKNQALYGWSRIIVHHHKPEERDTILRPFFDITKNAPFFPIAFRQLRRKKKNTSIFMLRNAQAILQRFAKLNMVIGSNAEEQMRMVIASGGVGALKPGQVEPKDTLRRAVLLRRQGGVAEVLDLSTLADDPSMAEIYVDLGRDFALRMLMEVLCEQCLQPQWSRNLRVLRMCGNRLQELLAFRKWPASVQLDVLDLSRNMIEKLEELRAFRHLCIADLILIDNPFIDQTVGWVAEVASILPQLKKINGINLAIVGPSGPQPNNEAEIRASIEQVLLQRVQMSDPASDLLDLSALAKNRIIAQMLQHMDTNCILRMILDTLCELSAEYLQHIRVLRLRGNRLHDLLAFRYWPESVELRVLDLSDNEIVDVDELSALSNMLIDNLVINNNPFNRTTPTPIVYIAKMLPNLQLINGDPISAGPKPTAESKLRATLKHVLERRRAAVGPPSPAELNLSAVCDEPKLSAMFKRQDKDSVLRMFVQVLCELSDELLHNIRVLRMCNNRLHDLLAFRQWPETVQLNVLDLSGNEIADMEQFESLKNVPLVELIVKYNPFIGTGGYANANIANIAKILPNLQRINGVSINAEPSTTTTSASAPQSTPPITATTTTTTTIALPTITPTPPTPVSLPEPVLLRPEPTWQPPTASAIGPQPLPADQAGDTITALSAMPLAIFERKYRNSAMWHRVVIEHNGAHTKADILHSLWVTLDRWPLHPCYYARHATHDAFFVRHTFGALHRLVTVKLLLRIRDTTADCAITLHMEAAEFRPDAGHVVPMECIRRALQKCYDPSTRHLEMSAFGTAHAELRHIELTVSNVMKTAADMHAGHPVQCVRLCNNALTSAAGLRPLAAFKTMRQLDLSGNRFTDVRSMAAALPALGGVTEFWLHGNPLGGDPAMQPLQYVHELKQFLPNLQQLDGEWLGTARLAPVQQNYVCAVAGADVVEQFCEQYFEALEGGRVMREMYAPRALMTMSCALPKGACGTVEATAMLQNYEQGARNLWRVPALGASMVCVGGKAIEKRWKTFQRLEHDYGSFAVDLTCWTEERCVFTVQGLYKEWMVKRSAGDVEQKVFGFVRTFVLRRMQTALGLFERSARYAVVNELVLVYQPSLEQLRGAFAKRPAVALGAADDVDGDSALTPDEMDGLVIVLQEITKLMPMWCRKFLEQSFWQLRSALELFVQMCEEDRLPEHAFMVVPMDVA